MNIQFKGTKYEPTGQVITHARKKIEPLERFLSSEESRAFLELERAIGGKQKGDVWRAELTIHEGGKLFRAESTKAKLDHAITTVARDVGEELRRTKNREKAEVKKGGSILKNLLRLGKH